MGEEKRKTICLYGLAQLALILEQPTGVWFYNRSAGYRRYHSEQEGILAIVGYDTEDLRDALAQYTLDMCELTEENADYIDSLFEKYFKENYSAQILKVNREKLTKSQEAWIYVTVDTKYEPREYEWPPFSGFNCGYGVVTWANSD